MNTNLPTYVHILTGFLGSGKTTLLNRLLVGEALTNTAVIVNEFGDVGIDHLLVESSEDQLVELSGGCLCCAVRGDLALTLADLLHRRAEGTCLPFERIIIETTGVADPVPVLNLLVTDARLAESVVVGDVITTVDAVNGIHTIGAHAVAARQVALADQLVVTKSDILGTDPNDLAGTVASGIDDVERTIRDINGRARMTRAVHGELPPGALADVLREEPSELRASRSLSFDGHSLHSHGAGIDSYTLLREAPIPGAALALFVEALAQHLGPQLLRMKGLVHLTEAPDRPALVQGAQHVFHPLDFLPAWPDRDERTRLVFIGEGLHGSWLEQLLDSIVAEVAATSQALS